MLPEPALSFTIPSLHDGIVLDCRVYHPASLAATNAKAPPWRRHAAVVAHPYAPMGGCYDDPILESVATQLLRTGYVVGTFNFRGAAHSAGRTSWTAKPERDDYASVVGFMVHYIHFLDPFGRPCTPPASTDEAATATEIPRSVPATPSIEREREPPVLIMGGYSYGAMITTQIPPLDELLEPFASPHVDSNAAQIRLRAQHVAEQQNLILGSMRSAMLEIRNPHGPAKRPGGGVRVGGDEGDRSPRKSHDSSGRRSFSLDAEDKFRKGVHEFMAKRRAKHGHLHWPHHGRSVSGSGFGQNGVAPRASSEDGIVVVADEKGSSSVESTNQAYAEAETEAEEKLPVIMGVLRPRPAYLLVSPLQGLVTHLATMSLLPSRMRTRQPHDDDGAEEKLVQNPTLAVFGDNDVFVPAGKLRAWTAKLGGKEGSLFTGYQVPSAGHFWVEEGVLGLLTERVRGFGDGLIRGEG